MFTIPKWMTGLKAREPEGTYTPDQVTAVLELNILFNDGDAQSLRDSISGLVPKVPLKHQKVLKAFLAMDTANMLVAVNEFITKVNLSLVQFIKEKADVREEQPVEPGGESDLRSDGSDWGDDWDRPSGPKPSTRGLRALRATKRQQAEA